MGTTCKRNSVGYQDTLLDGKAVEQITMGGGRFSLKGNLQTESSEEPARDALGRFPAWTRWPYGYLATIIIGSSNLYRLGQLDRSTLS